jgi:hypothetical protein
MHETGRGTSEAVRASNNPGGMMDPQTDWSTVKKFASLDEGIDAMAKNLKEKYINQGLTTIEGIQTKYAPIGAANDPRGLNKDWVADVTTFYKQLTGQDKAAKTKATVLHPGGTVSIPDLAIEDGIDATAPYMNKPRDVSGINRIIMHGDVKESARELLAYGRQIDPSRGFAPGYHFYIDRDGTVIQGAPIDRVTNHTLGENSNSIGINIAGADEGKMPTPAQERAAMVLISSLGLALGIPAKNVIGHGELQPHRRNRLEGGNVAANIRSHGYLKVPPATI